MNSGKTLNNKALTAGGLSNLDLAKFIMAMLVVLIHTRPFEGTSVIADFIVSDVIARVAVPVFYAISGFLFFRRLEYIDGKLTWSPENKKYLLRYLKRNSWIYLLWSVVYILLKLPAWYKSGWWGMPAVKDCITSFFFSGSHYHTWFLLSLLYAVPLLFGLLMIFPKKKLPLIIAIGWAVECLVYSYTWVIPNYPQPITWLLSRFPIVFDTCFRALPLLAIGAMLIECKDEEEKGYNRVFLVCALLICAAEATALKVFSPNEKYFSYLIATPFMAYYALRYLLTARQIGISSHTSAVLREASLIIYCLHPIVIQILEALGMQPGVFTALIVMIVSVAASVLWAGFRIAWRKKKS